MLSIIGLGLGFIGSLILASIAIRSREKILELTRSIVPAISTEERQKPRNTGRGNEKPSAGEGSLGAVKGEGAQASPLTQ